MTHDEQLKLWVEGTSVHGAMYEDDSLNIEPDGECCPDFSCCDPSLKWPREKREAFAAANQADRERMMLSGSVDLLKAAAQKGQLPENIIDQVKVILQ